MLNYVWLAILFLGIGAAVSTDLVNQSSNRYQNNQPVSVIVQYPSINLSRDTSFSSSIKISARDYNSFYKDSISSDIYIPALDSTPSPLFPCFEYFLK